MSRDDPRPERHARLLANGRISVPSAIRRANGWEIDAPLFIEQTEYGITLRTVRQHTEHLQAMFRDFMVGKEPFTVDDFIAEKRAEAAIEHAEYDSW